MFTGIIEEIGVVKAIEKKSNLYTLSLTAGKIAKAAKLGESIAVDGVCLTVTKIRGGELSFDVMKETLEKTTLSKLGSGSKVNLEQALRSGSRFGGHFVTGHVDGLGKISKIVRDANYIEFQISVPAHLNKFLVTKGSICVNGISLTVGKVKKNAFSVYMIPFTMKVTNFSDKKVGDFLNIEADILARYILGQKK